MFRKVLAIAAMFLALADATARAQFVPLNLTGTGSNSVSQATGTGALGGAFEVRRTDIQPTGTSGLDPFLTIQMKDQERGFNTNIDGVLDTKRVSGKDSEKGYTRAVQLKEFGTVDLGGTPYIQFLIDVNQSKGNSPISLNQVQLFVSPGDLGRTHGTDFTLQEATAAVDAIPATPAIPPKGKKPGIPATPGQEAIPAQNALISFPDVTGATEVFRLNDRPRSAGYEIQITSGHGSGSGDLYLNIASSLFDNFQSTDYLTLFMQFGNPPGRFESTAGFEVVSFLKGAGVGINSPTPASVPEPASIVMCFAGPLPLCLWALRRRKRATA